MSELFNSVIVCTKDRRSDLRDFLDSLVSQIRKPDELLIIDASEREEDIESMVKSKVSGNICPVKYYKTRPNLAFQRNFAVSKLDERCEIVSFFDDDVVLDPNYISSAMEVFEKGGGPDIAGVSGKISNARETGAKLIQKFFCLYSSKKGRILKSGFNVRNLDGLNEPVFIEWMPGGMATYRKSIFSNFRFDEYYSRNGAGREDLDFSFKVSRRYKLLFIPNAVLEHKESGISRISEEQFGYIQVVERYYFIKKNMNRLINKTAFWWSIFGVIVINLAKHRVQRLKGNFRGLLLCVFGEIGRENA